MSHHLHIKDLGTIPYREALTLQHEMRSQREKGEIEDTVLLCEHPPVFTLGKQECDSDFLSLRERIEEAGIDIVSVERGGRITYHGPGQLVVYYIVDVQNISTGVKIFVNQIEEICIQTLRRFNLAPSRKEKYPGIWIEDRKIAAIGLHVSKGISMHGMALNVDPNMEHYHHIIPCGIREYGVTSIVKELTSDNISMSDVKREVVQSIRTEFIQPKK